MIYEGFQERPEIRDVPRPQCPPDGAVVRVEATGLCRSDWHGWMGHDPDITLPHVPGHEFAGTIAEVGAEVTGWTAGDRVTTPFVNACGRCPRCRAGDQQVCDQQTQPGFTHWGSFAELTVVRHADVNLVRLPAAISAAAAASLGCRFATAYRAVVDHGGIGPKDPQPATPVSNHGGEHDPDTWIAVHGCGGVGLSAVMIAAAHGANVVAVDISSRALEAARTFGATAVVNGSKDDVPAAVRELTGGGAHVSLDALGHTTTFQNSLHSLRPRGRHVQVGLLVADAATQAVAMGPVVAQELELVGSHGMPAHHYPRMLDEIVSGLLRPELLLGREMTLDEGVDALIAMSGSSPTGVTILRP
ncbi:zinc-dependent alcohol dehydrogenase family protein [Phytoactinopolyspora mesophila]|uniref:Zinc-binding dehydrogenase n=1 Tax=Phytoactinopolyspora mesophila TaxID=2650750 RepID=A0A7K3M0H5_9ACTN|nr:zinc-dependent alcohol dehydrogenase family protein [Phytoactinopolyspora mesophila]NDL56774.1 zinc-binding dehydrogenase [Phytoactinopolyspora mesophila]